MGNARVAAFVSGRAVGGRSLRRQTAAEVIKSHENWGGLNLKEEELAADLVRRIRAGGYAFVSSVFDELASHDRDDVAQSMVELLSAAEVIRMGHDAAAAALFRRMAGELEGGWTTEGEASAADLLRAAAGDEPARVIWNRRRIASLGAPTDLAALAQMFEDDRIADDGTVQGRLRSILAATEHLVIPGLQTGVDFSDTGFAGDQNPNGAGFRDPWPQSRNQPGHFLTAVGLQFSPAVISREIPFFGSIRWMVQAPAGMSDQDVALRLTIGHEKGPDPSAVEAFMNILTTGVIESWKDGPEGETEEERNKRIGDAVARETRRQVDEIIAAYRAQFRATTDEDIAAWNEALQALGTDQQLNLGAAEAPLSRIHVDPTQRGNSRQDLRLSLVGWRLGQLIGSGGFADGHAVAAWIRQNLGPQPPPQP